MTSYPACQKLNGNCHTNKCSANVGKGISFERGKIIQHCFWIRLWEELLSNYRGKKQQEEEMSDYFTRHIRRKKPENENCSEVPITTPRSRGAGARAHPFARGSSPGARGLGDFPCRGRHGQMAQPVPSLNICLQEQQPRARQPGTHGQQAGGRVHGTGRCALGLACVPGD